MVQEKWALSFWGNFRDEAFEKKYLNEISESYKSHNLAAALVAGFGYWLVTLGDYAKLGLTENFYITASLRTAYLLFCLVIFFRLRKVKSLSTIRNLSFLIALGNSVLIISVIYFLNPDRVIDTIDQITVPLVTLLVYTYLEIPLILLFINGILVTLLYLFLLSRFFITTTDNVINIVVILCVINFMGVYLKRFFNIVRRKEYANKLTIEELNENLKNEIEERATTQQNLERALEQITDSIRYAQKIQFALLPSQQIIRQYFRESMILFQPRNIVSGDFYWLYKDENKLVVAVADCTGHGIPGAFMSVLGISLLNDIMRSSNNTDDKYSAGDILNMLRELVILSLQQSGGNSDRRDGMDMALVIIDKEAKTMEYSGAYNPLWIMRKVNAQPEIIEYRGDKMPIGKHTRETQVFTSQKIPLYSDDVIYLFTDGYKDQFGGPEGKKILSNNLKDILISNHHLNLQEQRQKLIDFFDQWKGKTEQVDDVLILGLKL
jgi:serine phosphatase RsbU (regulator of sigma subunit)